MLVRMEVGYQVAGRRKPARGVHLALGRPTWVWVTLCAAHRGRWVACEEVQAKLHATWEAATHWLVMDYVLMPDHVHFFAAPHVSSYPFDQWVTYFKRQFRKMHSHPEWKWQSHPFHHRLRDAAGYSEKWQYLRANPVREGLVANADEWPFQGRVHQITWAGG